MTEAKRLHIAEFRIRHISEGGSAYAVDMETGEQAFIGSHVLAKYTDLEIGDLLRCACEENFKTDSTEWYALVVELIEE